MFHKQALTPNGGELWTPETDSPLDVHQFLVGDIRAVVEAVRRNKVVVIENTQVTNAYWDLIPTDPLPQASHKDLIRIGEIEVHVLHSPDGQRYNTEYKFNKDLKRTAIQFLPALLKSIERVSEKLRRKYRIDNFIENIQHPEIPYLEPAELGNPTRLIEQDFDRLNHGELQGSFRMPTRRANDDAQLRELNKLKLALIQFHIAVTRFTNGYSHPWKEMPGSTVLAHQGDTLAYSANTGERIYHNRSFNVDNSLEESDLRRTFITTDFDSKRYYLLAEVIGSQRGWY